MGSKIPCTKPYGFIKTVLLNRIGSSKKQTSYLPESPIPPPKKNLPATIFQVLLLMEEILYQLMGSLSHYSQGFIHPRWFRISSINSMLSSGRISKVSTIQQGVFFHCARVNRPVSLPKAFTVALKQNSLGALRREVFENCRRC